MDHIPIEKENIPYQFEISLGNELFTLEVNYNEVHDFFSLDLIRSGEVLVYGAKLVYANPVFASIEDERFPLPLITPLDESGRETAVTWDNLGVTVFLAYGEEESEAALYE